MLYMYGMMRYMLWDRHFSKPAGDVPAATSQAAQSTPADPNGKKDKGTNKRGQKSSRSKFRKKTIQQSWNNAADGPNGGKLCPTCGTEVNTSPESGQPRDWDINHDPKWSQRELPDSSTRSDWISSYQEGTELECPACNRSDNQVPFVDDTTPQ